MRFLNTVDTCADSIEQRRHTLWIDIARAQVVELIDGLVDTRVFHRVVEGAQRHDHFLLGVLANDLFYLVEVLIVCAQGLQPASSHR